MPAPSTRRHWRLRLRLERERAPVLPGGGGRPLCARARAAGRWRTPAVRARSCRRIVAGARLGARAHAAARWRTVDSARARAAGWWQARASPRAGKNELGYRSARTATACAHGQMECEGAASCVVNPSDIKEALRAPADSVLEMTEVSELGYCRAFMVICRTPAAQTSSTWCLRAFDDTASTNTPRLKAAMRAFSASGATPHVECIRAAWSLERWLGPTYCIASSSLESMRNVGGLVAQVHKSVCTRWFDDYVQGVRVQFPALAHMLQHDIATPALVRLAGGENPDGRARDIEQFRYHRRAQQCA